MKVNSTRMKRETMAFGFAIGLVLGFSLAARAVIVCDGNGPVPCWVTASAATVAESGPRSAQFLFQLSGPVGQVTHLTIAVTGTATSGVDFEPLTNQVTIFAFQASATLTLTAIPDAIAEGAETVTVTITASDNLCVYVGSPNSATISIVEVAPPADALELWRTRNSGVTNALNADACGNEVWVTVGNEGTILSSAGGTGWTRRNSGTTAVLNSAVYANGLFVVVGASGSILTSTNGTNWTSRSSGTTDFLYDVSYGRGTFIAVSDTGTVLTSTNGTAWNRRSTGPTNVFGVAYGNGRFVAVGGQFVCFFIFCNNMSLAASSSDGVNWTQVGAGPAVYLSDLAFGNGLFVAVGEQGTIVTSTDGVNWQQQTSGTADYLLNIAFGDGTFVAVGAQQGTILTSTNGVNWTTRHSGITNGLFNVAHGNGTFVAVGNTGTILQSRYVGPTILRAPRFRPNGSLEIPIVGRMGRDYRLQTTTYLPATNWVDLMSFIQIDETNSVIDPGAAGLSSRFYRVVPAP